MEHSPVIAIDFLAAALFLLIGVVIGYGLRNLRHLYELVMIEVEAHKQAHEEDAVYEPQIVDDSPLAVAQRKDVKMRKGEEEDDEDSQIVTTRSPQQKQAVADAERERKLDKWMPGAKRDA